MALQRCHKDAFHSQGDSGGPLVCMDRQGTWKLFGINSYVANFCNMTERPNIFTNVRDFIPWIDSKTSRLKYFKRILENEKLVL